MNPNAIAILAALLMPQMPAADLLGYGRPRLASYGYEADPYVQNAHLEPEVGFGGGLEDILMGGGPPGAGDLGGILAGGGLEDVLGGGGDWGSLLVLLPVLLPDLLGGDGLGGILGSDSYGDPYGNDAYGDHPYGYDPYQAYDPYGGYDPYSRYDPYREPYYGDPYSRDPYRDDPFRYGRRDDWDDDWEDEWRRPETVYVYVPEPVYVVEQTCVPAYYGTRPIVFVGREDRRAARRWLTRWNGHDNGKKVGLRKKGRDFESGIIACSPEFVPVLISDRPETAWRPQNDVRRRFERRVDEDLSYRDVRRLMVQNRLDQVQRYGQRPAGFRPGPEIRVESRPPSSYKRSSTIAVRQREQRKSRTLDERLRATQRNGEQSDRTRRLIESPRARAATELEVRKRHEQARRSAFEARKAAQENRRAQFESRNKARSSYQRNQAENRKRAESARQEAVKKRSASFDRARQSASRVQDARREAFAKRRSNGQSRPEVKREARPTREDRVAPKPQERQRPTPEQGRKREDPKKNKESRGRKGG
jgi:hypothetical protein